MNAMADKEITRPRVDNKRLKDICKRPEDWFWRKYKDNVIESDSGRKCIYIDNGSNVLAVAHIDTVIDVRKQFNFNTYTRNETRVIKCPSLDDRLGVYIILDMLPSLLGKDWADILLTTDEEASKSTADVFMDARKEEKEYNWIVEFDRKGGHLTKGEDAVLYNYIIGGTDFKSALHEAGFAKLARGTFTDISDMEDMGVKAFNVAVGYHNNHSTKAFMHPIQTEYSVTNFIKFYNENKDTRFEHTKQTYRSFRASPHRTLAPYNDRAWNQSSMNYTYARVLRTGLEVEGAGFQLGDIVYNRRYKPESKVICAVAEVFEFDNGEYKYDVRNIDNSFTTPMVQEMHLVRANDVCSYCLTPSSPTWLYFDDSGMFYLCDMCRMFIMGGETMCEDCHEMFMPDKCEVSNSWPLICPSCIRAALLRPGDVVVFSLPEASSAVNGVPFLITGHAGDSGHFTLWDGERVYENDGAGYDSAWLQPIQYGVTMETFLINYGSQGWSARTKESVV